MFTIELTTPTETFTIYSPTSSKKEEQLLKADLDLEDNVAGSLSLTFPPGHPAIDKIEQYTSIVTVYNNGSWYWAGRCVTEKSIDIFGQMSCSFEGVLAALNDSIQTSAKYTGQTISQFIGTLLDAHNTKIRTKPTSRMVFYKGIVDVTDDNPDRYTEYETTLKCINDLVEDNGGHLKVRKDPNTTGYILDYVKNYNATNSQYINFGKNLLDYTVSESMSEFANALIPLGKEDEDGNKITIKTVNSGSEVLYDPDSVSKWGWIEKVAENNEIETPAALKSWAQTQLTASTSVDLTKEFEISAIDLHILDNNIQEIKICDMVRVVSFPHNLDKTIPVVKLSKNLLDPAGDKFTIGTVVNTSLTSTDGQFKALTEKTINNLPSESSILNKAKAEATDLINNATTGYVTVRPDALYITDNQDYTHATKMWKWTMGGLGYSSNGGQSFNVAITMNGAIVADFITTGTLNADLIRAGTIQDTQGNTSWNLSTGVFTMTKGSISLGSRNSSTAYVGLNRLKIEDDGDIFTTGNMVLAAPMSEASTSGYLACGKTLVSAEVESTYGIMLSSGQQNFYYANSIYVQDSPKRQGYIRSMGGSNDGGLQIVCEPYSGNDYGAFELKCCRFHSVSDTDGGDGVSTTVTAGGHSFKFINGICVSIT